MVDQLLDLPEEPPVDGSTPASDWTRYAGEYEEATEGFPAAQVGSVAIELDAEQLYVRLPKDGERHAMTQVSKDYWSVEVNGTPYTATFWPDASGRAEYITSTIATLKRTTPPRAKWGR